MDAPPQPLCLLVRVAGEAPAAAAWSPEARTSWWSEAFPEALRDQERAGGRLLGTWRSDWASDFQFFFAVEYPDLAALEAGAETLRSAGFFRNVVSSRLLGQRWKGEPGWDADRWAAGAPATLGGVLFYRISESLYTLTPEQMAARHDRRRERLDDGVDRLLAAGGRRIGAYFSEWSSEWHLFVLYEFPHLDALARFNADLPERHGYIDYDLDYLIGRRMPSDTLIPRM